MLREQIFLLIQIDLTCEYTVSFVVDKPDNFNWNIYVHKPQQEVKHKGRYDEKPPLEEQSSFFTVMLVD